MALNRLLVAFCLVAAVATLGCTGSAHDIVGRWRGKMYKDTVFDFRKDGTYVVTSIERLYRQDPNVHIRTEGTWRVAGGNIYCKTLKKEARGLVKSRAHFEEDRKRSLGRESKMDIKWISKDEWQPTLVAVGTFQRIKP